MAKNIKFLIDIPTRLDGNLTGPAEYYRLCDPVNMQSFEEGEREYWVVLWPYPDVPAEQTLTHPLEIRLRKGPDGRLVCTGLKIGQLRQRRVGGARWFEETEITTRQLAAIPLGQIMRQLAEHFGDIAMLTAAFAWQAAPGADQPGDPFTPRLQEHQASRPRPGRRGHPPEFWEHLAAVYRAALLANPQHPHAYVVKHFEYPAGRPYLVNSWTSNGEAMSRKLVRGARKLGYIGPAMPGKAGERPNAAAAAYLAATGNELAAPSEDDLAFTDYVLRKWQPGASEDALAAQWETEKAKRERRRSEAEEGVREGRKVLEKELRRLDRQVGKKPSELAKFVTWNWWGPDWQPGTSWSMLRDRWNAGHAEQQFPGKDDPQATKFAARARLAWQTDTVGVKWPDAAKLAELRKGRKGANEGSDGANT
jgi:hypothetical protein